jgi:hypothetical protein
MASQASPQGRLGAAPQNRTGCRDSRLVETRVLPNMLPYADPRASDVRCSEWNNTIIAGMTISMGMSTGMANSLGRHIHTRAHTNLRTRTPTGTGMRTE